MAEPEKEKLKLSEEEIGIIDFQSEEHSASSPKAGTRPVPARIKLLMGGIVLILIVGVGSLYAFSKKSSTPEVDNDVMAIGGGDSDQALGTNELIASLDKTRATAKKDKDGLSIGPVTEQEKLNERVISMEMQIQQLTQQIQDLAFQGKALKKLNTQIGEVAEHLKMAATQDDLSVMKQDFDERLQKAHDALKNAVPKSDKKAKPYASKKKYTPRRMPFKLVSIDQWDGVNYAAIQSKNLGAIENLRSGDTRSGWKVERIDTVESSVVFKQVKTRRSVKQTAF